MPYPQGTVSFPRAHRWILTVGIIVSALSVVAVALGIRATHDWNRRQFAALILKDFERDTDSYAAEFVRDFRLSDDRNPKILVKAEAESLFTASRGDSTSLRRRAVVISHLNYMKFVCTVYDQGVADKQIIRTMFRSWFNRTYRSLEAFIEVARERWGDESPYEVIRRVVGQEWVRNPPKHRGQTDAP